MASSDGHYVNVHSDSFQEYLRVLDDQLHIIVENYRIEGMQETYSPIRIKKQIVPVRYFCFTLYE